MRKVYPENVKRAIASEAIERLKRLLALQEVAKRDPSNLNQGSWKHGRAMAQYAGKILDRLREVVAEELTGKIMNWLEENATVELVAEGSHQNLMPTPRRTQRCRSCELSM